MNRTINRIILTVFIVIAVASCKKEPVRIACVGDSITYGHGIANRERDTYPALLDSLLGSGYDVRNFGISGRTLMNCGDFPYMSEQIYREALDFAPQIVTIMLGTNDSKPQNWTCKNNFKSDLKLLIDSFRELPSKPDVLLCLPVPAMGGAWGINDSVIYNGVIPYIKEVASEEGIRLIDLNTPMQSHREYFPDTIHPDEEGQKKISEIILPVIKSIKRKR
ncbi:MAG: hypothetical protein J5732_07890 [Bacteroidaceae bacterium]|nr:hypothetical protein [Bacteroidaceae bacterium]